ncbi:Cut8 six-helix bundle-domain-containing protein [Cokeromyces recurvatus]|uniref:Cut8 six-helix bundle-domain-containing protein n=1 Tax=Cokeromyces recurvatus TaxID=90255 RepID=UPI0022205A5A|nr:Cut8 six-helix bundle-domain-containing protein [Cokeromyces recurvatus]KAI7903436.1 Cut8 six-helix bundle-domain-containing protein [Cokeromyces recurvatus]
MNRGLKRRNSEDEEMEESSIKPLYRLSKIKNSDLKRQKTTYQKRSTRSALLDTLDKENLINIINSLLQKEPDLKEDIMKYIPAPTVSSSMNVLLDMEKKFYHSFPFNKNGPGRDDYTFTRVRDNLLDLIDTITQYANHFTTSIHVFPSTCFTFLDHASHIAYRLPIWDNDEHNNLKRDLYQDLNNFWKQAIKTTAANLRQAEYYSPESVNEWAKSLAQHNSVTGGYYIEAVHEFINQLGSMIGLSANNYNEFTNTIANITSPSLCHLASLETTLTSPSVVGDRR